MIGSVRGGWQARENLLLENLSDADYRVHGSGVNGTGLNAILAVKCGW